jgi:L-fuconolactonase
MTVAPVIDSHQHFWTDPTIEKYPWMTGELAGLRRSFGPDDLQPLLAANGVDGSIVVQSRASLEESRQLLEIAGDSDFVVGVVAWIDLAAAEVQDQLDALRASDNAPYLVGIRHQVHDEPDPQWLLRAEVQRGLRAVEAAGLVYELLVKEPQLPAALATARAFPGLSFVIDHIAKPRIADGPADPGWEEGMAPFSDLANVACKISGMVTEANWKTWQPEALAPYVQKVLRWFGSDRLVFGSDWPVCLLASSYDRVVATTRELLADLPPAAQNAVFGANAVRLYRLEVSSR